MIRLVNIKKNSFTRQQRLNNKADFQEIFTKANKTSSKNLLALWKPGNRQCNRIAIITGKKVAPSAVTRNQIKRVIRESYRLTKNGIARLDIIIIARKSCRYLSKLNLRKEINELWQKLIKQSQKSQLS